VSDVNTLQQENINTLLSDFTSIIRSVSDPLFEKNYNVKQNSSFDDKTLHKNAEWFDAECKRARQRYLEALRLFNSCKSDESRQQFYEYKKSYKNMVCKKKRKFKRNKLAELEKLRQCR